jgi:beta-fructofuranosidase
MLFISHNKGCQYYIGQYKDDRFFPDRHGRMTWQDNAYFAPEALIDKNGRQIMWAWVFDDRPDSIKTFTGWTGTFGLPRSLWLGKDGNLRMEPVRELQDLRQNERVKNNLTIPSGSEIDLSDLGKELIELEITIQPGAATQVGVMVGCSRDGREASSIYYDATEKKLKFDATKSSLDIGRKNIESAPFELEKGEPLVLRIFVDKSIVEVFANDRQAIARSVYPRLGGTGVKLFAKGGSVKINSVKAWEMMPSNPY